MDNIEYAFDNWRENGELPSVMIPGGPGQIDKLNKTFSQLHDPTDDHEFVILKFKFKILVHLALRHWKRAAKFLYELWHDYGDKTMQIYTSLNNFSTEEDGILISEVMMMPRTAAIPLLLRYIRAWAEPIEKID